MGRAFMDNRIIDALLELKADISEIKKSQLGLKDGQNRLEGKLYKIEDDMSDMRNDVSEVKVTVNALANALLSTSKDVKELKSKH